MGQWTNPSERIRSICAEQGRARFWRSVAVQKSKATSLRQSRSMEQFRKPTPSPPNMRAVPCTDGVIQAPAPAQLIEAELPTEATVAHVLVSKHVDQLPLYRQAQIMSRQGTDLDRSTLADGVGQAAYKRDQS